MSIYYTNSNNREIYAHSLNAAVINGVTGGIIPGPPGVPGPTGPTGSTGSTGPSSSNNPVNLIPNSSSSYSNLGGNGFLLSSPKMTQTGVTNTLLSDGTTGFVLGIYSVTGITGAFYQDGGLLHIEIIDAIGARTSLHCTGRANALWDLSNNAVITGSSSTYSSINTITNSGLATINLSTVATQSMPTASGNIVHFRAAVVTDAGAGPKGTAPYTVNYQNTINTSNMESISLITFP